jgi:hypothetical protein
MTANAYDTKGLGVNGPDSIRMAKWPLDRSERGRIRRTEVLSGLLFGRFDDGILRRRRHDSGFCSVGRSKEGLTTSSFPLREVLCGYRNSDSCR